MGDTNKKANNAHTNNNKTKQRTFQTEKLKTTHGTRTLNKNGHKHDQIHKPKIHNTHNNNGTINKGDTYTHINTHKYRIQRTTTNTNLQTMNNKTTNKIKP